MVFCFLGGDVVVACAVEEEAEKEVGVARIYW